MVQVIDVLCLKDWSTRTHMHMQPPVLLLLNNYVPLEKVTLSRYTATSQHLHLPLVAKSSFLFYVVTLQRSKETDVVAPQAK